MVTAISYLRKPWKRKLIALSKTFNNKCGLEIGGPSPRVFGLGNIFPVYVYAKRVDGVNFSNYTIWEGEIAAGKRYAYFQQKMGYQYIAEATDLSIIQAGMYNFVLSSHSLEHVANPIKALQEWNRVLKPGGRLVLVLPDKNNCFDTGRDYTSFQHFIADFESGTEEDDLTHMDENIRTHNSNSKTLTDLASFREKLSNNFMNRMAHHHVFSLETIRKILDFNGFSTIYQQTCPPFHLVSVAKKR